MSCFPGYTYRRSSQSCREHDNQPEWTGSNFRTNQHQPIQQLMVVCDSFVYASAGKFTIDRSRRHGELGMFAALDPGGKRSQLLQRSWRHAVARFGEKLWHVTHQPVLPAFLRSGVDRTHSIFNLHFPSPPPPQVRHGNHSCVKTLVESGAWLGQRNALGFTPREDLLNAKPMFTRGRLPKALRTTLEYIEYAEVRELLSRKHAAPASCTAEYHVLLPCLLPGEYR